MKRLNYLEDFIITLSFQITMFYDLWRNNANIEFRTENRKSRCLFSSHILCTIKLEFRLYTIKRHELFVQYSNVAAMYFAILQKFSLINYIKSYLQASIFIIKRLISLHIFFLIQRAFEIDKHAAKIKKYKKTSKQSVKHISQIWMEFFDGHCMSKIKHLWCISINWSILLMCECV